MERAKRRDRALREEHRNVAKVIPRLACAENVRRLIVRLVLADRLPFEQEEEVQPTLALLQ